MIQGKGLLRTYSCFFLSLFKTLDLSIIATVGIVSHYLQYQYLPNAPRATALIALSLLSFVLVADQTDLYRPRRGQTVRSEIALLGLTGAIVMVVVLVMGALIDPYSFYEATAGWVLAWLPVTIVGQGMVRVLLRTVLERLRRCGWNQRHVLLIGGSANGQQLIDELSLHPEFGLNIIGYVDDRTNSRENSIVQAPKLGAIADIHKILDEHKVDQIWVTYPFEEEEWIGRVLEELKYSTISVRCVLDLNIFKRNQKTITEIAGVPLLDVDVSPMDSAISRYVKGLEDRVIAAVLLVLFSPLFILIALGVKLSSPGPIFYRQVRISWNNRPFEMYKFRSMPVDVEKKTGPKWASTGEARATRFGAFLRKASLDELPQLLNVLRGDMSIVGPRPERPVFVEQFKDQIPDYMKKHMVKAGITGWAQVNGLRGDTDLKARIEYDLYYIKHWSLAFDVRIALQTIVGGFVSKNAY